MFLAWCTNWRQRRSSHICRVCVHATVSGRLTDELVPGARSSYECWFEYEKSNLWLKWELNPPEHPLLDLAQCSCFICILELTNLFISSVFQVGQVLCVEEEKSWFGSFITRRTKRKLFLFLCSITEYFLHERTRGLPLHSGATSPKTTNTHTSCGSVWFWERTFWL